MSGIVTAMNSVAHQEHEFDVNLHGKVTFSRKVKRWILGVLGSSTRMSFLAPNHVFWLVFLGMEALNVRLAALNLREISEGGSWWS